MVQAISTLLTGSLFPIRLLVLFLLPVICQAEAAENAFEKPNLTAKPKFRYWLPDANLDSHTLADDIAAAKQAGSGGVEYLGIYNYGFMGELQPTPDWSTYAWGSPAWISRFKDALEATKLSGQVMDIPIGPNSGQGVPVMANNTDALVWELRPCNSSVKPGQEFNGIIPGWGQGELVALYSAAVTSYNPFNYLAIPLTGGPATSITKYNVTFSVASLVDRKSDVGADGQLHIQLPVAPNVLEYRLFAIYLNHSGERATIAGPNPQDYIQNGSLAVDHFSSRGAQAVIDFWNMVILPEVEPLVKAVGNYIWEDSVEVGGSLFWTKLLPQRFESDHGYSITPFLPVLFRPETESIDMKIQGSVGLNEIYRTDEPDGGQSHFDDYRTTLANMYGEYLASLRNWSNERLGKEFSSQVGYNLPVDVLSLVPEVDVPELESLGFNRLIDNYRQYVGPANLAGRKVISDEVGANLGAAYRLFMPDLLFDISRAHAAGVNQMVIHGFPYSGIVLNTTWPSYTTFTYLFSEMHGPRQPAWPHYYDVLTYVGRVQTVLQTGVPRRDVAFWLKDLSGTITVPKYYSDDLISEGYSYEYLSPDNFALPQAIVEDKVLAPTGPAYQALVIRSNDTMTVFGAQKLAEYASNGLPVIVQGGWPSLSNTVGGQNAQKQVQKILTNLTSIKNVHIIPANSSIAQTLLSLEIQPRVAFSTPSPNLYTNWRYDQEATTDYIFVYSDMSASDGELIFRSTGIPFLMNAWTGETRAISNYTRLGDGRTLIYLSLAGNQTAIIGLSSTLTSKVVRPQKGCISERTTTVTEQGQVIVQQLLTPQDLNNWNLIITEHGPPLNLLDTNVTRYINHEFNITTLVPWSQLPGMANVSGTGCYFTTFCIDDQSASGAILKLGPVIHTIQIWVNEKRVGPVDLANPMLDISDFLQPHGVINTLMITVATPLSNELSPFYSRLHTFGVTPILPAGASQEYGLLGLAQIHPYINEPC